ncbi:MAG TPA: DUF4956 domain-containing protein [Vicinamibacteria bacterium]
MPNAVKPPRCAAAGMLVAVLLAVLLPQAHAWGQELSAVPSPAPAAAPPPAAHAAEEMSLKEALISLPVAAVLGAALAFRPRRRGTPPRNPAVIQTQIILALVGALVMLVVGASLARAFGIVGAASLVRYRSKIDDPKDAGVMLSCLALGLASGVGIYWVAAVSAVFILAVLWVLESLEPEGQKQFVLKIKAKEPAQLQDGVEGVLRRNRIKYELRTTSPEDLEYFVILPRSKKTDRLTDAIVALRGKQNEMAVEWSDKKQKGGDA